MGWFLWNLENRLFNREELNTVVNFGSGQDDVIIGLTFGTARPKVDPQDWPKVRPRTRGHNSVKSQPTSINIFSPTDLAINLSYVGY